MNTARTVAAGMWSGMPGAVDDSRPWRLILTVPLVVSALLFIVPQYFFVRMSFHANLGYGRIGESLTLENYVRLFTDPLYLAALGRTVGLSGLVALICLAVGFPVAYVLARARTRWIAWLLGMLVASAFITAVVKDLGLIILLSEGGVLNRALQGVGLLARPMRWLGTEAGVFIGLVHYTLPMLVLLLYTVLQTVPRRLEDAAHVHGASRRRVFQRVIIPLARPGIVAATLMVFNLAMGAFTTPALLGGGRVLTFPILIQRTVILDVNYPFGAALSTVLLVVVFGLNVVAGYLMLRHGSRVRALRAEAV